MSLRLINATVCLFFLSCQPKTLSTTANPIGVTLSLNWDYQEKAGAEKKNFVKSVDIFYYENLVMYRDKIPLLLFGKQETSEGMDTVHIRQELIEDTTQNTSDYWYFIFEKGAETGAWYISKPEAQPFVFNVDSLLRNIGLKGASFYTANDSLVHTEIQHGGFDLFQKYIPKKKIDASYCDTTYMYFSKTLKQIPYSFSEDLEKKFHAKLAKVIFIYNSGADENGDIIAARRVQSELKSLDIVDSKQIISLFDRFKKESKMK